jgi:hypothetical protein
MHVGLDIVSTSLQNETKDSIRFVRFCCRVMMVETSTTKYEERASSNGVDRRRRRTSVRRPYDYVITTKPFVAVRRTDARSAAVSAVECLSIHCGNTRARQLYPPLRNPSEPLAANFFRVLCVLVGPKRCQRGEQKERVFLRLERVGIEVQKTSWHERV